MSSRDLLEVGEVRKAEAERAFLESTVKHRVVVNDALTEVCNLRYVAREQFGAVQCGPHVNVALADYYRELDEAERALRNAANAITAMQARPRAVTA